MKTSSILAAATGLLLSVTSTFAKAPPGWTEDYAKAIETAKAEHKHVLLDFTGSDWCGWCMKLDKEIFDKPAFKSFAKENLVLVKVDFPHGPISEKIKKQNAGLQEKFNVHGFPTLYILDTDGKEVWKQRGYMQGGPEAFIQATRDLVTKKG